MAAGMTQSDLAEQSGLRQATVSGLENGKTRAQSGTVHALAVALNQDPEIVGKVLAANDTPVDEKPASRLQAKSEEESFNLQNLGKLEWNWKNAQRATEGHAKQWKDAMLFLDPVLKKHPEFLEARILMRNAEVEAALKIPLSDRIPPPQSFIGKAHKKLDEGAPLDAIQILEGKVFVYLPGNIKANAVLHEAALAAGLPQTARFALEFAASRNPELKEAFQQLADFYQSIGEFENACTALKRIIIIDPGNLEAEKSLRDTMARASMKSGKIEIKDQGERLELERSERISLTGDEKRKEVERLVQGFQESNPDDNPAVSMEKKKGLRKAIGLSRELGENDLRYLEYALELQELLASSFPQDPVLRAQVDELSVAVSEQKLAIARAEMEKCSGAEAESKQEEIQKFQSEKSEIQLTVAEQAVLSNPTNAEAQLQLGKAYMELSRFREAVNPLQKAKKDPRVGIDIEAMSLLSDCFVEGNLVELAVKEIDEALHKLDGDGGKEADYQWKTLSYKKAMLFLKLDKPTEARELFSDIYAKDSDFKDVEVRVWGS